MSRLPLVLAVLAGLGGLAVGCKDDGAGAAEPSPPPPSRGLAGVSPDAWHCDSAAPPAALAEVLGGKITPIETSGSLPRGLPRPCSYEVAGLAAPATERWTFDIDCRDGMKLRADRLFEQYKADSRDQVEHYEQLADAGIKPTDAGVDLHPPEPAVEVFVGAKALDHHGRGLIFIDDDAPCYVRVIGRDAARRLELAKLIAKNLTFANAPMSPRAFP